MRTVKTLALGIAAFALTLAMTFQSGSLTAFAEDSYGYTIKIYAGKEGTFADGSTEITVATDVPYGSQVDLSSYMNQVNLKDSQQYKVKGIRESGKDNNTVGNARFTVTGDREYVVAYGIAGNMVQYTVNYQDQNGNALRPSETYWGEIGTQAVVAYLYVDGYQPQAYNLLKTLVEDESQNVLTFTYTQIQRNQSGTGNNSTGTTTTTGTTDTTRTTGTTDTTGTTGATGTTDTTGTTGTTDTTGTTGTTGATDTTGTTGTTDTTETTTTTTNAGNVVTDTTGNQATVDVVDEKTPQEQINLDDEENEKVPKSNLKTSTSNRPMTIMMALGAVAVIAVIALIAVIVVMRRRK